MMANKWIQAVLMGGIGFGLIIGSVITMILVTTNPSNALYVILVGVAFMVISLWKTANCRGTDGWGGPYHGPEGK